MSRTIHKYNLLPGEPGYCLMLPEGAKVLAIGNQNELLMLWAEVDPDAALEPRHFVTYSTGHPMPDDPGTYIGTTIFMSGSLVWHVYETKGSTS